MKQCAECASDRTDLMRVDRPSVGRAESGGPVFNLVDLFSGAGGLSVGALQATSTIGCNLQVPLAIEHNPELAALYAGNFPSATVMAEDISAVFDGELGAATTAVERRLEMGAVDLMVAGPPCQGHSDLNNHTRRSDPKNLLYLRAVRAAQVMRPRFILIENVPGVRHDTARVVRRATEALGDAGYAVSGRVLKFDELGVAQRRRRYVLLASRDHELDPEKMFDQLACCDTRRDVRWAIGDLVDRRGPSLVDLPASSAPSTKARMQYLLDTGLYELPDALRPACHRDKAHSYRSVYGRLRWELPAQTITTGFSSMGQGRYMHPERARTLTPREAARLQGLPDWYHWGEAKRTTICTAIGNAVPPALTKRLVTSLIRNWSVS